MIVLAVTFHGDDGKLRIETFGPWQQAEDESHLAQITEFIREFRNRHWGLLNIVLAAVQDPATWLAATARDSENGQASTVDPGGT